MALRPLAFGVRLRDKDRTLRVFKAGSASRRYVVEDSRAAQKSRKREHGSLAGALKDAATTWRNRLN
jgi:hypothetical protein